MLGGKLEGSGRAEVPADRPRAAPPADDGLQVK